VNDPKWDLLDGGICANLPSQFLEGSRKIAIGFADPNPERETRGSKWVRTIDLLDAAIDYSVDRSIQLIGKDNCCQLPTLLSTFDFASVVGKGADIKAAETRSVETATRHFFDKFIARERGERKLNGDPWKLAQSTSAVSEALHRALTKIDSLTPSKFPQKSLKQEFVLHIDPENPRSTFRTEMHEERLVDAIIDTAAPCERSASRYLKTTLAFPADASIEDRSYVGLVGEETRLLPHTPCLDGELAHIRRDYIERVVLLDLVDLLKMKISHAELRQTNGIRVQSKLIAMGLVKYLCDTEEGEEFLMDLKRVSSEAIDVSIKVHMPDQFINSCDYQKTGWTMASVIARTSSQLPNIGESPWKSDFGYFLYQASNVIVSNTTKVGFNLLLTPKPR
jgi:hypothetical protein